MSIRKPAFAGHFYPENKHVLKQQVRNFISAKVPPVSGKLKALVVPHAGYAYSGSVAGAAYSFLSTHSSIGQEIVLLGPSHLFSFEGAALATYGWWKTPLGLVATSPRVKEFKSGLVKEMNAAHEQEHCLEVQLPFLQTTLSDFSIIPLVCGSVSPEILAENLEKNFSKNTLLIVSTDLSHYLPYDAAQKQDKKTIHLICDLNSKELEFSGNACGKIPLLVLMDIARENGWKPTILDYKNSGDTGGDCARVVGYAALAFLE